MKQLQAPYTKESVQEADFDRDFRPRGAVAFFLLLIALGLFIWFSIYFIMLGRA